MASENEENMIVGLDIGTSKIVAIVGSVGPRESWRLSVQVCIHPQV